MTTVRAAGRISGSRAISPRVQMWVPAQEGSGNALDLVGGNHLVPAAGNDAAWAVAGFISSKATAQGTDGSLSAGTATPVNLFDITSESLLIAMQIKSPAHAAASRIFGTSSGNGATAHGVSYGSNATLTRLGARLQASDTTTIGSGNEWAVDILDNNVHTLVTMVDGPGSKWWQWVDGVMIQDPALSTFAPNTTPPKSVVNTTDALRIGRVTSASLAPTRLTSIRNLQIARVAGNIPANFRQLADEYANNPFRPWSAGVLA